MSNREIYHFIAKILALGTGTGGSDGSGQWENHPAGRLQGTDLRGSDLRGSDPAEIISIIRKERVNWKQLVFMASNNFVLQTIYLKFLHHGILPSIPADLAGHLQHIYDLNLERNRKILDQCSYINRLLKANRINAVFMKGAGNMLDRLYQDPGERIMSDIDVLTGPGKMEEAARLLLEEGFSTTEPFDPSRRDALKHYPGLRREGLPAFVELHRLPVNIQFSDRFDYPMIERQARPALGDPSFLVMSDAHNIILTFCHSQLVHWGHQHARPSLRDLYDMLLLSHRQDPALVLSGFVPFRGKAAGFLRVMQKTFGISSGFPPGLQGRGHGLLLRHNLAMASPRTGTILFRVLRAWRLYIGIPVMGLFSKNYRRYMRVRLRDPRWYERNFGINIRKKEPE
jgi:hypothetical protein